MAKKQFAINMLANITAFAIQFGINFFFTPYLIRTVGKEAYSFFPLANSFISYVSILTIALNSMASRFITIKIQQNDHEGANVYFNSVLMGNTILAGFMTIPSILTVVFIKHLLNVPPEIVSEVQILFGLILGGTLLSIVTSVFVVATFARNRLELESLRNAESNILRVALLIFLFHFFRPSISYIGFANLAVVIFMLIVNIRYTRILLPEIKINKKYFNTGAIKELLSSGVWNSINQLSLVLLTNLDLLICNILLGASITGEYALVKTIPLFIQSLVGMLVGVFVPEFVILYAKNKKSELLYSINRSIKLMAIIMTIPLGFLLVFGDAFFKLWVPGQDVAKLFLLSNLTIIPLIITTSINTVYNVYTVTNKLKVPALVLLITGILNTLIILILLHTTNKGVIIIPLVSLVIGLSRNLLFTPIYAAKSLDVKWNIFYKAIFRGIICCLAVVSISLAVRYFIIPNGWISFLTAASAVGLLAFIANIFIALNKGELKIISDMVIKLLRKFKLLNN
jgi:O-antigen/teichoic acid export membrane protein